MTESLYNDTATTSEFDFDAQTYSDTTEVGLDSTVRRVFEFGLEDKSKPNRAPWVALRLYSGHSDTQAPAQNPRYVGGDSVDGSVVLDLVRPQTILSIFVLLRGRMNVVSAPEKGHIFLEVIQTIYNHASELEPAAPASHWGLSESANDAMSTGKFRGQHEWPFSIPFPTDIEHSRPNSKQRSNQLRGNGVQTFPTPQTISHGGTDIRITYEVVVKITTAGFWNTKHRITTPILYVPLSVPPQLPVLRKDAYLSGSGLTGPEEDPPGWQPLAPVQLRLSRSDTQGRRQAEVECKIYIAKPTIYTRGTVIPCYLTCNVSGPEGDSTLLTDFFARHSLSLTLHQRVEHTDDPRQVLASQATKYTKGSTVIRGEPFSLMEERGTAVWWTPTMPSPTTPKPHLVDSIDDANKSAASTSQLRLEGEMHLDGDLLPTFEVPFLSVSHFVEASLNDNTPDIQATPIRSHSPTTNGGTANQLEHSLFPSYPIQIVTARALRGPAPVAFTSPP